MSPRRTVHLVSLGCPKNRVDSEVLLGVAEQEGLRHVADPAEADVIVVNTCGFIGNAKKESLETIFELASYKGGRCDTLVVAGCLSQRHPRELADQMPEVDHFLGSSDMLRLADVLRGGAPRMLVGNPAEWLVNAADPRRVSTGSASAYVKIAEGCNRTCSFCVIPQLRGKQRSRTADDVVREVEALASRGVFEINLVSQDTVSYGRDLPKAGREGLGALVARVAEVPGVRWVRLHYLYPESLTAELVELLSGHPRVLPYVDMPLQHAADAMLRRMRRGHGGDRLRRVVSTLREKVPGLVFRTAFIVGHPGETDEEFDELLSFVEWAQFDHVGVFRYSDEESSQSYALEGKVPARASAARHRRLMALQRRVAHAKNAALVGRTLEVLVEGSSDEHEYVMMGRHAGQAPGVDGQVYLSGEPAKAGELRRVTVTQASDYDLVGDVLDEEPLVSAPRAPRGGDRRRLPMAPRAVSLREKNPISGAILPPKRHKPRPFGGGQGLSLYYLVVTEPAPGALLTPSLRLTRHLARGSMGSLWLARHDGFGAEVVVKFLCERASTRLDIARFEREATVLAAVQSPYVVRYLEHGVSAANMPYLVLERLEGCDLSVALRQHGPLDPTPAALVVEQVALALSAIHRLGVVHRDVKPSNIFLCGGLQSPPVVKLLDFGIAKSLRAGEPLTSTGQMVGTPNFMSPEQFKAAAVDHRTDLWALGVVAYRAMTGQLPFGGETFVEVIMQVTAGRPPKPSAVRAGLPREVDRWFERACALDPEARFASAEQMAQSLWEAIGARGRTVMAPPPFEGAMRPPGPTTLGASSLPASAIGASSAAPTVPSMHKRRGFRRLAAAGAIALPLALAAAWGVARRPARGPLADALARVRPAATAAAAPPKAAPAQSAAAPAQARAAPCPQGMAALGGANTQASAVPAPAAYCLDAHEVTVDEYRACVREGACPPTSSHSSAAGAAARQALDSLCTADLPGRDRHPINCVDWAAANAYCRHARKRLPRADEWEFAVRGCSGRTYPWGEDPPSANRLNGCDGECVRWGARHRMTFDALYNEDDGFYATAPVGTFPQGRSVEGVDDLLGNVMEWAGDGAGDRPYGEGAPRLVMGSGWNVSSPSALRMPPRASMPASTRDPLVGFRCASTPPPRP